MKEVKIFLDSSYRSNPKWKNYTQKYTDFGVQIGKRNKNQNGKFGNLNGKIIKSNFQSLTSEYSLTFHLYGAVHIKPYKLESFLNGKSANKVSTFRVFF